MPNLKGYSGSRAKARSLASREQKVIQIFP